MSFLLDYYDDMLDDSESSNTSSDDLHMILLNDLHSDESESSSSSLGMTIVSSAPSFEEEIVFEWPSLQSQMHQQQQQQQQPPMSISTHESLSLTTSLEGWMFASQSPQDMCVIIPCDEENEINSSNNSSELSLHPSSVPSGSVILSSDLWTSCSRKDSDDDDDDEKEEEENSVPSPMESSDISWEHIHRVCHEEQQQCGVYLQMQHSGRIVTAPCSNWYQGLSTEDEWEEMKLRIQDIFLAFSPSDFESYTAEELLALWIEQEEELFWSKQEEIITRPRQQYYWGEAVVVAAAVASFGVLLLRRS